MTTMATRLAMLGAVCGLVALVRHEKQPLQAARAVSARRSALRAYPRTYHAMDDEAPAEESEAPIDELEAPIDELEAPIDEAPEAEAPVTAAPNTEAPEAEAPVTAAPNTEAPVTAAPNTEAPVTEAPVTEVPLTEAPATNAPTLAPPTSVPTASPPTDAPTRLVAIATFVLSTEVDNATDAESIGNKLCDAIESAAGITCEYIRACSGSTCFEMSALASRSVVALEAKDWGFELELVTLMKEEDLKTFLVENGEVIVKESNVNGTFVGVDVRTPTGAPIVYREMSVDLVLPSGLEPTSESVTQGEEMVAILEAAIDLTATFVSVCSTTSCAYPEENQARSAHALQAGANVWTYTFDVNTDESDDDVREAVIAVGATLAAAISDDAMFLNVRFNKVDDDDDDLSSGAVAVVVVACVFFCAILGAVVAYVVLNKQREDNNTVPNEPITVEPEEA